MNVVLWNNNVNVDLSIVRYERIWHLGILYWILLYTHFSRRHRSSNRLYQDVSLWCARNILKETHTHTHALSISKVRISSVFASSRLNNMHIPIWITVQRRCSLRISMFHLAHLLRLIVNCVTFDQSPIQPSLLWRHLPSYNVRRWAQRYWKSTKNYNWRYQSNKFHICFISIHIEVKWWARTK